MRKQIQEEESQVSSLLDYLPGSSEHSETCQGKGEVEDLGEQQPTCLLQMPCLIGMC